MQSERLSGDRSKPYKWCRPILRMGANWRLGFGGTHRMGSGLELMHLGDLWAIPRRGFSSIKVICGFAPGGHLWA